MMASWGRISALILRYFYLFKGSWPRTLELAYWPTVQLLIWGFVTLHFLGSSDWLAKASGVLVTAVLLWDVLFRGQLGYSISFLEELWSRNLGHLFVSPLRPWEFMIALTIVSLLRTLVGILPAAFLAAPLFGVSVWETGLPLAAFFGNLMLLGWAMGMAITGLILRVGLGAESIAWAAIFILAPISAVYYPIDVLPSWLQSIAWGLPPAYVFEGMRSVLFGQGFRLDLFLGALGLNAIYLALGAGTFLYNFRAARIEGKLLQTGE